MKAGPHGLRHKSTSLFTEFGETGLCFMEQIFPGFPALPELSMIYRVPNEQLFLLIVKVTPN